MNHTERIAELEAEVTRLRKLGRTKREPVAGIGGVIQKLREQRELGVRAYAEACGLNGGAISLIESGNGDNPTWEKIKALAMGLGLKPSELVAAFEEAERT